SARPPRTTETMPASSARSTRVSLARSASRRMTLPCRSAGVAYPRTRQRLPPAWTARRPSIRRTLARRLDRSARRFRSARAHWSSLVLVMAPAHRDDDRAVRARLRSLREAAFPFPSRRPSAHRAARSADARDPRYVPTARSTAASSAVTRRRVRTRAPAGAATTNGAAISRSRPLTSRLPESNSRANRNTKVAERSLTLTIRKPGPHPGGYGQTVRPREHVNDALGSRHSAPLRQPGQASSYHFDPVLGEMDSAVARGGDDRAVPSVELAGGDHRDVPTGNGQPDPGRPVECPLLRQPQGAVPDAAVIAQDERLDPLGRQGRARDIGDRSGGRGERQVPPAELACACPPVPALDGVGGRGEQDRVGPAPRARADHVEPARTGSVQRRCGAVGPDDAAVVEGVDPDAAEVRRSPWGRRDRHVDHGQPQRECPEQFTPLSQALVHARDAVDHRGEVNTPLIAAGGERGDLPGRPWREIIPPVPDQGGLARGAGAAADPLG